MAWELRAPALHPVQPMDERQMSAQAGVGETWGEAGGGGAMSRANWRPSLSCKDWRWWSGAGTFRIMEEAKLLAKPDVSERRAC